MKIKMSETGKTDAELLEMIYNTNSHSKVDKDLPDANFTLENNIPDPADTIIEKDMENIPGPDSMLESEEIENGLKIDEIKQEVLDSHGIQTSGRNMIYSGDKGLAADPSLREVTNEHSSNDRQLNQSSRHKRSEYNHKDDTKQLVTAIKIASEASTHQTQCKAGDPSNAELYLLTKEELVDKLISCREELNSMRKQLTRSERQLAKSDDYNELLREKVETLSSQIHSYKQGTYTEAGIQVDQNDLINYTIGEPCMPDWGVESTQGLANPSTSVTENSEENDSKMPDESSMSIADSIKMAAQDVVNRQTQDTLLLQGYVYDENYGLYYHSQSGYYYDSEKMLYYEPHSGTYYYYDYETGQYAFHSQINIQEYGYGNTTNTDKTKVSDSLTKKISTSKKKKTSESRTRKNGGKITEQVFKNRQERRKAMREEHERKMKRKEDRRKKKDEKRDETRKSSKKKKRRKSDNHSDSDGADSLLDKKRRKSSKKHKKHKKKVKKEKKQKKDLDNDDVGKTDENVDIGIENLTDVRMVIDDKVKDVIDISDEELVISEEEGELNEQIGMEVEEPHASGIENENVNVDPEELTISLLEEGVDKKNDIEIEEYEDEISAMPEFEKENKENCDNQRSEENEVIKTMSEKCEEYESISEESDSDLSSESESGEISDSSTYQSDESSDSEDDVCIVDDSENQELGEHITEDITQSWRPCVRVIVTESDCVDVGMLYIATYQGTSIGRGKENGICVPDMNVSKFHAEIQYNDDERNYTIMDKGSQNGTFVNSDRISLPKETSEPKAFKHGDVIQVGDTKLLCHIHSGTDTCDDCEPGVVMAKYKQLHQKQDLKFISKEERKKLQRQELNEIKKRYGLKNAAYEDPSAQIRNPNYEDKAAERRKTVGSDTPHKKHEAPASVHRPISSENKGHKMLEKMGWKEGESLGKNNTGIQEPISVSLRVNQSAGLGSGVSGVFSADDANSLDVKKACRRIQALQRYTALEKSQEGGGTSEMTEVKIEESSTKGDVKPKSKFKMAWNKGDTEFT